MELPQPSYDCSLLTLMCSGPAVDQAFTVGKMALNSNMSDALGFVGVSSTFDWQTKDPGKFLEAVVRGILGNVKNAFVQSFTPGNLTVRLVVTNKEAADTLLGMYESEEMLKKLNAAIEEYSKEFNEDLGKIDSVYLINYNERSIPIEKVDKVERRASLCFQNKSKKSKVALDPIWVSPSEIMLEKDDNDVLGRGGFGSVLCCYYEKVGLCAVKCVAASGGIMQKDTATEKFEKQAGIFLMADHANIVRVYGITSWVGSFGLIMEYMEGGNLSELMKSALLKDYQVPFNLLVRILLQVGAGVAFLHQIRGDMQIVHGDLKPSNIVLKEDFTAKVADFGGAELRTCTGTNDGGRTADNTEYTLVYAAPERILYPELAATKACDVYSYGMIVYECLSDLVPYNQAFRVDELWKTKLENAKEIQRPECKRIVNKKERYSGERLDHLLFLEKCMESCWRYNKDDRPKMKSVRDDLQEYFDKLPTKQILKSIFEVSCQLNIPSRSRLSRSSTERIPIHRLYAPNFRPSDARKDSSTPTQPDGNRKRRLEGQSTGHHLQKVSREFAGQATTSTTESGNKKQSLVRKIESALSADAKVLESATRELCNALKALRKAGGSVCSDDNAVLMWELNDIYDDTMDEQE